MVLSCYPAVPAPEIVWDGRDQHMIILPSPVVKQHHNREGIILAGTKLVLPSHARDFAAQTMLWGSGNRARKTTTGQQIQARLCSDSHSRDHVSAMFEPGMCHLASLGSWNSGPLQAAAVSTHTKRGREPVPRRTRIVRRNYVPAWRKG